MIIHTVMQGESIFSISQKYGVPISRLLSDNQTDPTKLVPGQTLVIQNDVVTYTVKEKDTLNSIANAYGITVRQILRYNPSLSGQKTLIYPGQTLVIEQTEPPEYPIYTNAYVYPFVNRDVLIRTLPYLSYVTPFTYGFTESGELIDTDDGEILSLAYEFGTKAIMHLSTLGADGKFSNRLSSAIFFDTEARERLTDNIIETMKQKAYSGLDIDFEYIPSEEADAYADFIRYVEGRLDENGFFLITALAPKQNAEQPGLLYEGHDYQKLGEASDDVFLMTYEWGYSYGPPRAISPLYEVTSVLDYAVSETDPSKIYLGIPNYAYDWKLPYVAGQGRADTITNEKAKDIAFSQRAEIEFDKRSAAPFFKYTENGRIHEVWFEDARSYESLLALISRYGLKGFAVWNGMSFDPQLWLVTNSLYKILDL